MIAASNELDLPYHLKIHPVFNIVYLKEYRLSPERFGKRDLIMAVDAPADRAAYHDAVTLKGGELRGQRDIRGQPKFLVYWRDRLDHDDTSERQELVNDHVRLTAYSST